MDPIIYETLEIHDEGDIPTFDANTLVFFEKQNLFAIVVDSDGSIKQFQLNDTKDDWEFMSALPLALTAVKLDDDAIIVNAPVWYKINQAGGYSENDFVYKCLPTIYKITKNAGQYDIYFLEAFSKGAGEWVSAQSDLATVKSSFVKDGMPTIVNMPDWVSDITPQLMIEGLSRASSVVSIGNTLFRIDRKEPRGKGLFDKKDRPYLISLSVYSAAKRKVEWIDGAASDLEGVVSFLNAAHANENLPITFEKHGILRDCVLYDESGNLRLPIPEHALSPGDVVCICGERFEKLMFVGNATGTEVKRRWSYGDIEGVYQKNGVGLFVPLKDDGDPDFTKPRTAGTAKLYLAAAATREMIAKVGHHMRFNGIKIEDVEPMDINVGDVVRIEGNGDELYTIKSICNDHVRLSHEHGTRLADVSELVLVRKGDVSRYLENPSEYAFESLEDEIQMHVRLGHQQHLKNPRTGNYAHFTKRDIRAVLESGVGAYAITEPGLFGSLPRVQMNRFPDYPDLEKRILEKMKVGFNVG